ncbi:hypothetical protein PANN_25210 [Pseudomonas aeruginosa C-NN2]|nr:hypothetical protein PANN_25210 [Pseudomonas aeruginosa C-NN2]
MAILDDGQPNVVMQAEQGPSMEVAESTVLDSFDDSDA